MHQKFYTVVMTGVGLNDCKAPTFSPVQIPQKRLQLLLIHDGACGVALAQMPPCLLQPGDLQIQKRERSINIAACTASGGQNGMNGLARYLSSTLIKKEKGRYTVNVYISVD